MKGNSHVEFLSIAATRSNDPVAYVSKTHKFCFFFSPHFHSFIHIDLKKKNNNNVFDLCVSGVC